MESIFHKDINTQYFLKYMTEKLRLTCIYEQKHEYRSPFEQIAQEQYAACNDQHDSALYEESNIIFIEKFIDIQLVQNLTQHIWVIMFFVI